MMMQLKTKKMTQIKEKTSNFNLTKEEIKILKKALLNQKWMKKETEIVMNLFDKLQLLK